MNCCHCDNTCMIPVYIGGGYTGVARCEECELSREQVQVMRRVLRDGRSAKVIVDKKRVAFGLKPFRKHAGRSPGNYRDELRAVQERSEAFIEKNGGLSLSVDYAEQVGLVE